FYASFDVSDVFNYAGSAEHPVLFDAVYYLRQNPDVRDAFNADHTLAWQHYLQFGAAESLSPDAEAGTRAPMPWFDIDFYLSANPDVAAAADGPSFAFRHFIEHGMTEFRAPNRSEEHTSELQSREKIVCRLLLEKQKTEYR